MKEVIYKDRTFYVHDYILTFSLPNSDLWGETFVQVFLVNSSRKNFDTNVCQNKCCQNKKHGEKYSNPKNK